MTGLRAILLSCVAFVCAATASTAWAESNREAVAVVIGNRDYGKDIPDVSFAHRDADAMSRFLSEVRGYRTDNIIDLRDATQAQLEATFGNARSHQGRLWRWVRQGESDVTVFYSGHGMPGLRDGEAYLLPVDADASAPALNGYPLRLLIDNLTKLEARMATVYLDACFSGQSAGGPLLRQASGLTVLPRPLPESGAVTVVAAAASDQIASWDEDARHGLFTDHLLDALYGAADRAEFGDDDGTVTLAELQRYLDREMTHAARRRLGRVQTASVSGDTAAVLSVFAPDRPPIRPRPEGPPPQADDTGPELEQIRLSLQSGDTAAVIRDGVPLLQRLGRSRELERMLNAAMLSDVNRQAGLKRIDRAQRYMAAVGHVPELRASLEREVRRTLASAQVTSRGRARYFLQRLPQLQANLGSMPELILLEAQAYHHLGRYDEARRGYRRWMAAAGSSHPLWPRVVNAAKQAERGLLP